MVIFFFQPLPPKKITIQENILTQLKIGAFYFMSLPAFFFFNFYNCVCGGSRLCIFACMHVFISSMILIIKYHCLLPLQILKLYAWESSYQKKIIEIREQELEVQKSAGYLAVFSMLTLTCIPFLVSVYNISHFDFQIRFVDSPPSYLELRCPNWNLLYLK